MHQHAKAGFEGTILAAVRSRERSASRHQLGRVSTPMPLSRQERRCIRLVCRHLEQTIGGTWRTKPGPSLIWRVRGRQPTPPTPETVIYDRERTAAVEVKQLTGTLGWNSYLAAYVSLRRSLSPLSGGRYLLDLALGVTLPLDERLLKTLRKQIRAHAPTISLGETRALKFKRRGEVRCANSVGAGLVFCEHNEHTVREVGPLVTGAYQLADGGWEHQFVTSQGEADFQSKLAAACTRAAVEGAVSFEWEEEWGLTRLEGPDGVIVPAVHGAEDVGAGVAAIVAQMITQARLKFAERWADRHIVVLDMQDIIRWLGGKRMVTVALDELNASAFDGIDSVLLADGGRIDEVWSR